MKYNKSPFQWAGSKNKALDNILPIIKSFEFDVFAEPFVGAANVSLNVEAENYLWNDFNKDLINSYEAMFYDKDKYLELCKIYFDEYGFDGYNNFRDIFNRTDFNTTRASLFQYLNKHGFNGLCRYNKKGQFNVPRGTVTKNPKQVPIEQIDTLCKRHKYNTDLFYTSYEDFIHNCDMESVRMLVYCFDEKTEILTDHGWKYVKDIKLEDNCLSREPNTSRIEWVGVANKYNRKYTGKMYNYKGKCLDIRVTEDHNVFFKDYSGKERLIKAKDVLTKKGHFICGGAKWEAPHQEYFDLCGHTVNMEDFAYLLGIFITDGSFNNEGSTTISQKEGAISNKIKSTLDNLGIEYSIYRTRDDILSFYISRKYINFFEKFYLKYERDIPKEFKESSTRVLDSLLEGILDGDGDKSKDDRKRITIGSKRLVDSISEICFKLGYSTTYKKNKPKKSFYKKENRWIEGKNSYYTLSVNITDYRIKKKINQSLEDVENEQVYCLTLDKWHTVLTRRNGKTVWLGQCDPPYVPLTSDFKYTADGFNEQDHIKLKDLSLHSKNTVLISNHWTEFTEELYSDADEIHIFDVQRTISCKGDERKKVKECLVIYNEK